MAVLGVVLLAGLALRLGLAQHLPVTCPLRRLTGIPCASCGLTRAAVALTHGQLVVAAGYNLAALPLALCLVVVLVLLVWEAIAQRPLLLPLWNRCSGVFTWLAVVLLLAAWGVNLHDHFRGRAKGNPGADNPTGARNCQWCSASSSTSAGGRHATD